jgi:hypothetical protein
MLAGISRRTPWNEGIRLKTTEAASETPLAKLQHPTHLSPLDRPGLSLTLRRFRQIPCSSRFQPEPLSTSVISVLGLFKQLLPTLWGTHSDSALALNKLDVLSLSQDMAESPQAAERGQSCSLGPLKLPPPSTDTHCCPAPPPWETEAGFRLLRV